MEKKEYQKPIDYAKRALEIEKQYKNPANGVESYEFLATCYTELGEKEKSNSISEIIPILRIVLAMRKKRILILR
ncbi:hypothetical protein [Epilithonimonas sp.]|uniref:hypothetical protein n=1 Tax=Epilithonimonas sp. TaxID=2894511 RepID=UPI0028A26A21|nr:hypothetical protein [Epilithonimonas sp.]